MKATFVVGLAFLCVVAANKPQFYTFEAQRGPGVAAEDQVEVDFDEQYLLARIIPIRGNVQPSVNLHDFAAGYTAIKDEVRDTCFVMEVSHTLQGLMDDFKQSVQKRGHYEIQRAFVCTDKRFLSDEERGDYGERIKDFCEGNDMIYAKKRFVPRKTRSTTVMAGNEYWCVGCSGSCS